MNTAMSDRKLTLDDISDLRAYEREREAREDGENQLARNHVERCVNGRVSQAVGINRPALWRGGAA